MMFRRLVKKITLMLSGVAAIMTLHHTPVHASTFDNQRYQHIIQNRECTYDWYQEFVSMESQLPETNRPDPITKYFSDSELDLFYRVVMAEIGGEQYSFAQRVNVVTVIINRWVASDCPKLDQILTASQFSTVRSGKINSVNVTDEVIAACQYALWFGGEIQGAYFFNNSRSWDNCYKYLGYDGAHYFYARND